MQMDEWAVKEISIHPPRVGRDGNMFTEAVYTKISIHPPRVGRDFSGAERRHWPGYFNPPSPCGEGQCGPDYCKIPKLFQSTLPVWGGT